MLKITPESFRSNPCLVRFAQQLGYDVVACHGRFIIRHHGSPEPLAAVFRDARPLVQRLHRWSEVSRYQAAAFLVGMAMTKPRAKSK